MIYTDNKINGLLNLLNNLPISKWGVGDTSGLHPHPLAKDFPKVITLALAFKLDFEKYNESKIGRAHV